MERQQNGYSIRESTISLHAGERKCWRYDPAAAWVSVERAALAHFQQEGWSGDSGEGKIVLSLIKATSFTVLPTTLHSRYVESIYSNNAGYIDVREHNIKLGIDPETPASSLVEAFNREREAEVISPSDRIANILTASEQRISNNFKIMTGPGSHTLSLFPSLTLENMLGLYKALGNQRLSQIAEIFGTAPYILRSGWPDLTLWRGSEVVFKEIKAPGDHPRVNQIQTIDRVLLPLGFDVEFVRVILAS
jgi:hypothetical protein